MHQTVERVLHSGIERLRGGTESARFDALLLLEHQLGRSKEWIVAHGEASIARQDAQCFARSCARRAGGVPLAYIVGNVGFYGRRFTVSDDVLVPRPQTEHLVDEALEFVRGFDRQIVAVLDVGTGSGAIACSVAAGNPRTRVVGTDLSARALAVASGNAARLGVAARCTFVQGDLHAPVAGRRFDVLIANLPYVPSNEIPSLPDPVAFEPRLALDGGPDGLALYRRLVPHAPSLLLPGALMLLEAAPAQIPALLALVAAAFPGQRPAQGNDYGGRARYVIVQR